jgi:hypothetical protein
LWNFDELMQEAYPEGLGGQEKLRTKEMLEVQGIEWNQIRGIADEGQSHLRTHREKPEEPKSCHNR